MDKLAVTVIVDNDKKYFYDFTEEFVFGILCVTSYSSRFTFVISDKEIILDDILPNYTDKKDKRYKALLLLEAVYIEFETTDVIRGIITGVSWLNKDPHKYITDITDNSIRVTF